MGSSRKALTVIGAGALAVIGTAADAQSASSDSVLDQLFSCRAEADAARRLSCFDAAAARLEKARGAREIVVMNREEVREKRRALFGLPLPNINLFGRNDDSDEKVSLITTKAVDVARYGRDRWRVRMEDGSTWETTEPARFDPKKGDAVIIKSAALGSFRASFAGQSAVRIQRLR
jgi:hypothetical protein